MKVFSFTMPATTNYYQLWTLLTGITGFIPANAIIPDRCCQLTISSDSGALLLSDANNANVAGVPMASGTKVDIRAPSNNISLKEIYLKGNGLNVSGFFVWM